MVIEVDVKVGGGVIAGVVTGMVARDVVREEGSGLYPSMVASLGVGDGMVVIW